MKASQIRLKNGVTMQWSLLILYTNKQHTWSFLCCWCSRFLKN